MIENYAFIDVNRAELLGRLERLSGIDIQANPYEVGSACWKAFNKGWLRDIDDPISKKRTRQRMLPTYSVEQ